MWFHLFLNNMSYALMFLICSWASRRLRQRVDSKFNMISMLLKYSHIFHCSLDISWAKGRLRQRVVDKFNMISMTFQYFLYVDVSLHISWAEKATAESFLIHFGIIFHTFSACNFWIVFISIWGCIWEYIWWLFDDFPGRKRYLAKPRFLSTVP